MFITNQAVTTLKQVTQIIPSLDYLETASLLHGVTDAIRQGSSLGNALEELRLDIKGITDDVYGLLPSVADIWDEKKLIALVGSCTAHLTKTYSCI